MDNTVNKKPTLTAINMKRDQQNIQDKQIIALMDQRRILSEQTEQNWTDLLFVGYIPPETDQGPIKMTHQEWIKDQEIAGHILVRTDVFDKLKSAASVTQGMKRELDSVINQRDSISAKNKALKKEISLLRKAKGFVSERAVLKTLKGIRKKK